jgi:hypothetical protein
MPTSTPPASVPEAKPNYVFTSGARDALGLNNSDRRYRVAGPADQAQQKIHAASPGLMVLAYRVARLNPDAGEIGAGMLKSLVEDARAVVLQAGGTKAW